MRWHRSSPPLRCPRALPSHDAVYLDLHLHSVSRQAGLHTRHTLHSAARAARAAAHLNTWRILLLRTGHYETTMCAVVYSTEVAMNFVKVWDFFVIKYFNRLCSWLTRLGKGKLNHCLSFYQDTILSSVIYNGGENLNIELKIVQNKCTYMF